MLAPLIRLLGEWSHREPSASLFVLVAAVLLFATSFVRLVNDKNRVLYGFRALFLALLRSLVVVGILGAFYFLLDTEYNNFIPAARAIGSDEKTAKEVSLAQKRWGGWIIQQELSVKQSIAHQVIETIPGVGGEIQYRNRTDVEKVNQESLGDFRGSIDIHLIDPHLNKYIADARYEYEVINHQDVETSADFKFPIDPMHYYENVKVLINGTELLAHKKFSSGRMEWNLKMLPQERVRVVVAYSVRGTDLFYYRIPSQRGIENFSLRMSVNSPLFYIRTDPGEQAINTQVEKAESGLGVITWTIDRAVTQPEMGIQLRSPLKVDSLQLQAIDLVRFTPRGSMWLGIMIIFTMLICGISTELRKLILLLGVYSGQFLMVMALDLTGVNYLISLPVVSLCTLWLVSVIYHELPRLALRLVSIVTLLFSIGYPLGGLLPGGPPRTAFDAMLQSAILLYIFCLSLYVRVGKQVAGAVRANPDN